MQLSERISGFKASPIRRLRPYADAAKARGVKVYHLNIGQPDIKTPENVIAAIQKIDLKVIEYGPSAGLDDYRNALPTYYARHGIFLSPDDILVTTAGSEAILFTFMAICDPGDEVIIPEPYYTNFFSFARMAGVKLIPVTTTLETGFKLPPVETFAAKITDKTKAIMLCNPGNPTGHVYKKDELASIVRLVKEKGLYMIADEVYREFVYDGLQHTSILTFDEIADQAVVVDSISKRYSACGMRVGALICRNHDLIESVLKLGQARLCPPTIEQIAARAAIDTPEHYTKEVHKEYQKRRDLIYSLLMNIPGVTCSHPEGAFYIIAQLPVDDAEDFAQFMLSDFDLNGETVMMAPAEGFYSTPGMGKNQVRIAYVLNCEAITKAVACLEAGLKAYAELKEQGLR